MSEIESHCLWNASRIVTAAQMRALEHAAIEAGRVTGLDLMERAGQGVVQAIFDHWPELDPVLPGGLAPQTPQDISGQKMGRSVVLCGPGNNGGDGFVIARILHGLGFEVEVYLFGSAERLPEDARRNFDRWCALGAVKTLGPGGFGAADLFIDALFGTGLRRPLPQEVLDWVAASPLATRRVAVDLPSGVCSDSGRALGGDERVLQADLTVSFHCWKLGHVLAEGPQMCGRSVVVDIGLPRAQEAQGVRSVCLGQSIDLLRKQGRGHKFGHGHAVVVAGGVGQTGAARLAARGALRIGTGLVTLAVPQAAVSEVAAQVTAIMVRPLGETQDLLDIVSDRRVTALCLGPGMGFEPVQRLLPIALSTRRPTVLDADALSAYADSSDELFKLLHSDCILTPHAGEFARLFPDLASRLCETPTIGPAYSKVDATRAAARRAGCIVVFKGSDTVIADPQGRCSVHAAAYDRAAPWLATAGSGDVLAGFISGLLARGFGTLTAAEAAVWLHVSCALSFGPGLIAEDLPEQLPNVFRTLGV